MPLGHKLGRKTIMTRLMPLGHNPSTRLMPLRHKVSVYGIYISIYRNNPHIVPRTDRTFFFWALRPGYFDTMGYFEQQCFFSTISGPFNTISIYFMPNF